MYPVGIVIDNSQFSKSLDNQSGELVIAWVCHDGTKVPLGLLPVYIYLSLETPRVVWVDARVMPRPGLGREHKESRSLKHRSILNNGTILRK